MWVGLGVGVWVGVFVTVGVVVLVAVGLGIGVGVSVKVGVGGIADKVFAARVWTNSGVVLTVDIVSQDVISVLINIRDKMMALVVFLSILSSHFLIKMNMQIDFIPQSKRIILHGERYFCQVAIVSRPIQQRKSIRLPGYDYSSAGAYFVTICTKDRLCVMAEIINDGTQLSPEGKFVADAWLDLPNHYHHVRLDEFVIMPNHVHGIIFLLDDPYVGEGIVGEGHAGEGHVGEGHVGEGHVGEGHVGEGHVGEGLRPSPTSTGGHKRHGLPEIIRAFKSFSARRINQYRNTQGESFWQRSYYEHVIRNEHSLNAIRLYIRANPLNWNRDANNPFYRK